MTDQANALRNRVMSKRFESDTREIEKFAKIITVTGGKGGIGKTNIAVNLAINFSKSGKKVIILDVDFSLANVEILFGITPKFSLVHVVLGNKKIEDVITDGPMGIKFISAGSGFKELANIRENEMKYIIKSFGYLDSAFDIIIIDTGAGISNSVINFTKISNEVIIVTTPEPTAITDAYSLIKILTEDKNKTNNFKIIVNKVDDEKEGLEVFKKLESVCESFLGANVVSLGSIPDDKYLVKAVKRQQPVSICYPDAEVTKAIECISQKMLSLYTNTNGEYIGIGSYIRNFVNIFKD